MGKKVKPLLDRVLIMRIKAPSTKGGILLPDSAKEKPQIGEVIEVGDGKMDAKGKITPLSIKKGDKVLFSSYAGTKVELDEVHEENEYMILGEDDILAIVL